MIADHGIDCPCSDCEEDRDWADEDMPTNPGRWALRELHEPEEFWPADEEGESDG